MTRKIVLPACLCLLFAAASAPAATAVSIETTIAACKAGGNRASGPGVQSRVKQEASLIGMAYLNYIYQNDLANPHFCQSMLLMHSQVPAGTPNPYVALFDAGRGEKTIAVLQDVQLAFDYSIARTNPPAAKLSASVDNVRAALK